MLHALRIPLTGLIIGSASVIFISLIAFYSPDRRTIIRSVTMVLLVKFAVSPHSPPPAYFAVAVQGLLGYLLFFSKKFYRPSAVILGVSALLISALQRVILYTLIYGENLWKTIDGFGRFITDQLPITAKISSLSLWIIAVYTGIHFIAGLGAGIISAKLPEWVERKGSVAHPDLSDLPEALEAFEIKRKKKRTFTRPFGIAVFILAVLTIVLSYVFPHFPKSAALEAVLMIVRAGLIITVWIFFLSPFMKRILGKFSGKKMAAYSNEIDHIKEMFPRTRVIVSWCWKSARGRILPLRVIDFIVLTLWVVLQDRWEPE